MSEINLYPLVWRTRWEVVYRSAYCRHTYVPPPPLGCFFFAYGYSGILNLVGSVFGMDQTVCVHVADFSIIHS